MYNFLIAWVVMNHLSVSNQIMTIIIVFGSVILTLVYVAWKRYYYNHHRSNFIDKNYTDE